MTLEAAFELFKRSVLLEDPEATVEITRPAIKAIQGSFSHPIADLHCTVHGVKYKHCLVRDAFKGSFETIPFRNID